MLYFNCVVADCALSLSLMVPWGGGWFVIMAFPGQTHFLNNN